ncbi:MAG: GTP-binding protein [Candidatus Heimdallarchaeota archaeon]|nr:GTP-binding protein [Candidatus Heimdallarchaeota archaeon]
MESRSPEEDIKIVVTGPYNAGKSEFVQRFGSKPMNVAVNGTTVGLDFTHEMIENYHVHIFGTPGQDHFKDVQQCVARGASGIIMVIDSTDPSTFSQVEALTKRIKAVCGRVPLVICANKQDKSGAITPEKIKQMLDFKGKVIGTSALHGEGTKTTLIEVLKQIKQERG